LIQDKVYKDFNDKFHAEWERKEEIKKKEDDSRYQEDKERQR